MQTYLVAVTPRTITDPERLHQEIAEVQRLGYAVAPEESLLGINALAAPIYNYAGALVGSIGLIGSVQHIGSPPSAHLTERLLQLIRDVSRDLGVAAR